MKKTRFCYPEAINRWAILILLFFFIAYNSKSQSAVPLKQALDSLESRFDVSFSYADESIQNIFVDLPEELSLENSVGFLNKNTSLSFQKISDRFIAISIKKKLQYCGILIDQKHGDPIPDAIILISDSTFVTSDDSGYFHVISQNAITISHIGYYSKSYTLSDTSDCITIPLVPKISELKSIYVKNYLARGINKQVFGDIQINTKELQVLPGLSEPDVLYTLQVLPGVQSPDESVSDINIRGGTNDQNLILWDGMKMYQTSHFYGLISAFNPYFTENIILTKNGSDAELGDGVSGTLDIRSKESVVKSFSGGAGINLISADAFADVPLSKNASLSFSIRRSIADLIKTPTYNNYFDRSFRNTQVTSPNSPDSVINNNESFTFFDISAKLIYEISEKDKLSFSILEVFDNLNYNQNAIIQGNEESRESELSQNSFAGGVKYQRRWNNSFITSANTYFTRYRLKAINDDVLNNQRLLQENEVLEFATKIKASYIINPSLDVEGGIQYVETGIANLEDINNPAFRRRIKNVIRNESAYIQGNYSSLDKKTNLKLGMRANYYSTLDRFIFEPRFSLRYEFISDLSLEILGEQKNQTTTQIIDLQNDFLGVEKRRWVLSDDEDIPVIQSQQISAGLHYDKESLLVSIEAYYKLVEGIITSSQAFQNQFEFLRSSGEYQVTGMDALLNKRFHQYSTWISYAIAKNMFEFPQLSVRSFPNNLDILHNLTYGISYSGESLELSSSLNWHSGRPYTPVNEDNPIAAGIISYQSPNSGRLNKYARVDLSGAYRFSIDETDAKLGFSIWNLTANENILNTYYRIDEESELKEIDEKGLGFTPNLFFRVSF